MGPIAASVGLLVVLSCDLPGNGQNCGSRSNSYRADTNKAASKLFKLASSSTIVDATFSTGPFDVDRYSMKSQKIS
jgi:hypothetical protein